MLTLFCDWIINSIVQLPPTCGPKTSNVMSAGSLSEMQILRTHSRPSKSHLQEKSPGTCFNKPSRWLLCLLKFEKQNTALLSLYFCIHICAGLCVLKEWSLFYFLYFIQLYYSSAMRHMCIISYYFLSLCLLNFLLNYFNKLKSIENNVINTQVLPHDLKLDKTLLFMLDYFLK